MVIDNTTNHIPNNSKTKLEKKLHEIEEFLFKKKLKDEIQYNRWQEDYNHIYNEKSINFRLYINHAILYYIGLGFLFKFLFDKKNKSFLQEFEINELKNVDLSLNYFSSITCSLIKEDIDNLTDLIYLIIDQVINLGIKPEYLFDYLVQNMFSSILRHESGEFYTPPFLVKKMVKESYKFGFKVLDPCCGSGNFLIEIIKSILASDKPKQEKIYAINNIHGYDINPLSIFLTKVNCIYLLKDFPIKNKINLNVCDFLFPKIDNNSEKFDLVIGNPPWYTFRDISSIIYQEKIKKLSEDLEIKPLPKNILNIEISSLFFYQSKEKYVKEDGHVFLVMTKGVITGSHASRFRCFNGFKNLKIWLFDKKVEIVFNIDFICLYAQKSNKNIKYLDKEIPCICYTIENNKRSVDYFDKLELKQKSVDILVPYSVEKKGNKFYVKKLILKEIKKKLLPTRASYYKNLFHKGADLNPRSLIFVKCEEVNSAFFKINPDKRIFKRAKEPWTEMEYKDQIVEKQYIFNVMKSTELIKFYVYDCYQVFLPLTKNDLSFNLENLEENAKVFYEKINKIYLNKKKGTTKHGSLMENLNRWNKLINERQLSTIKVVYNNSGSTLNSAVIQGDFLITGDLSFFATENLDEAHYLAAILNSPIMTNQIKIKKSSRHIFKIPLEIPLKKFEPTNQNHKRLVELAKKCQRIVISVVNNKNNFKEIISKNKIQNILREKLKMEMDEIDNILKLEFN
ncbi:MAG: class I SAM-dependent DNA methyltransferase [Promethearchaeota archaeon]